jgi:hypothetical protein
MGHDEQEDPKKRRRRKKYKYPPKTGKYGGRKKQVAFVAQSKHGGHHRRHAVQQSQVGPYPTKDRIPNNPKNSWKLPKGIFERTAATRFQPSLARIDNPAKVLLELEHFMTPPELQNVEGVLAKRNELVKHLRTEIHAQATGKHGQWIIDRDRLIEERNKLEKDLTPAQIAQIDKLTIHKMHEDNANAEQFVDDQIKHGEMAGAVRRMKSDLGEKVDKINKGKA